MTHIADNPIGVFDSGVGGLSVFAHLTALLPHENYIYLADTLHVPYGSRQDNEILELTLQAIDWLISQHCKLIVIACNSASAHSLAAARLRYPNVPIVGLVPALKPAVMHSQSKKVAILATPATLQGRLLNEVIDKVALPKHVQVYKYSMASLVPWVEAGMPQIHGAVQELDNFLSDLLAQGIDELVLGCTHYPFFKRYLQAKLNKQFTLKPESYDNKAISPLGLNIIDSGQAIAKRVQSLLNQYQLLNTQSQVTPLNFYSTSCQAHNQRVVMRLIKQFMPTLQVSFYQVNY